jgi:nucleoside-diphosphate-sugar epimerase
VGEVFNISYGQRISINELFYKIRGLLCKDEIKPIYKNPRHGDVRHSLADVDRARKLLEFKPQYDIESGLRKTLEWYKDNLFLFTKDFKVKKICDQTFLVSAL